MKPTRARSLLPRPSHASRLPAFALLLLASFATGCSGLLQAPPDSSRYFVLSSLETAPPPEHPLRHPDIHFGLGPVKIPAYLDNQSLVRSGGGSLDYIPDAYWAESLTTGFPRALLFRTGARIGTTHAIAYPWYSTTRVDWKVPVDVLRFEATLDGHAVLVARWSVERTSDGAVVAGAQSSYDEVGGADAAQVVDAMSRCVDRLADAIASAVMQAAEAGPASAPSRGKR